jgi:hypothetical protein
VTANAKLDAAQGRAEQAGTDRQRVRQELVAARVAANTRQTAALGAIGATKSAAEKGGTLRAQSKVIVVSGVLGAILGVIASALAQGVV